jgi:hypothetical protein
MTTQAHRPGTARRSTTLLRRLALLLLALATLSLATAGPALAYAPVDTVHTEHVKVGLYDVTVGFSAWPIRAMQSLDFTFSPDGGIAGKSGQLILNGPGVRADRHITPLARHPRKLDTWGLDIRALSAPGSYSFGFVIDGPQGHGEGTLAGVPVLDQPGPPLALSWAIASVPFVALIAFLVVAWRRTQPGRQALAV